MKKVARATCLGVTLLSAVTAAAAAAAAATAPATVPTAPAPAASPHVLDDVNRALRAAEQPRDRFAMTRLWRQIARRHGQNALGPLIDAMSDPRSPETGRFAARAVIEVMDRYNHFGLKAYADRGPPSGDLGDLALVALSLSDEPAARDHLLRSAAAGSPCAIGLLRPGHPARVRPLVAAALRDEELPVLSRDGLRSVLAALDYVETLNDPADRAAYRAFERTMWWGYAVAPKGSKIADLPVRNAADLVRRTLGPVDDRFVLRAGTDAASTPTERRIAAHLVTAGPRSPWFRQEVEQATTTGSPEARQWATDVLRALEWQQGQTPANPPAAPPAR